MSIGLVLFSRQQRLMRQGDVHDQRSFLAVPSGLCWQDRLKWQVKSDGSPCGALSLPPFGWTISDQASLGWELKPTRARGCGTADSHLSCLRVVQLRREVLTVQEGGERSQRCGPSNLIALAIATSGTIEVPVFCRNGVW